MMKPGGSGLAAVYRGKLILGLSGNPAAAVVSLLIQAMPFVRKLTGRREVLPEKVRVRTLNDFPKSSPNRRFVRGRLVIEDGAAGFFAMDGQGNGILSSLVGCDLIGEIPAGSPPLPAGTLIDAYRV
jgi:molybdopterin molybdotransferase